MENRVSGVYAKYDPNYLAAAKAAVEAVWDEIMAAAHKWLADHRRTTPQRGRPIQVVKREEKEYISKRLNGGGR